MLATPKHQYPRIFLLVIYVTVLSGAKSATRPIVLNEHSLGMLRLVRFEDTLLVEALHCA